MYEKKMPDKLRMIVMGGFSQMLVSDIAGNQVPKLQEALILTWAAKAEELGYDIEGLVIECPDGQITLHRLASGLNFSVKRI